MLNPGAGALDPAAARGFAAYGNAGNMGQAAQGNFPLGALQGGMQGAGINVRANLAGLQANAQAGLQANAQGRFAAAQLQNNLQNNLQNLQQQQLAGQFQRQGALNNANLGNGVLGGNAAAAAVAAGVRAGGALGGMNNPALTSIRPGVDRGGNIGLAGMGAAGVGQQNLGMQGFQQATLQQALQQANNQQQQAALQQRLAAGGIGLGQGNMQQMQQAQQNAARLQNMGVNMMQQGMPATNAQGQDLLAMLGRNKAAGQNVLGANNVEAYAALMKQQQQREQAQQAQQVQAQQAQAQQAQQQQQQQQQQGRPQGVPGGLQGGPGPGQDFNVNTEDFPALPGTGAPRGGDDGGGRGPYGSMQGNAAAVLGRGGYMLGGDQYGAGGLGDVARAQAAGLADYDAIIRFQQQQQQAQAAVGAAAAAQRPGVGKPGGLGGPMGAGPLGADGINGPGKAGIGAGAAQERMGPPPDKWGLLAIMPLLKMTDQDATTLELGINLTTLGLDLTSPSSLHKALVTPLSAHPIKAEPEFDLPACYKHIPQRLQPGYLSKFKDETLFYIFYSMPGDEAQLVAADELSVRNWSFHKRLRMWMTPDLQAPPPQKSARGERGTYVVFNPTAWQPEVKPDQEIFIDDWEQAPRLLRPQQRPPGGPTGPGGPQQQAGPGGAPQAGPGQPPGPVAPVAR